MNLQDFYLSLLSMDDVEGRFYIKGYTETLKLIDGVRVVPNTYFSDEAPSGFKEWMFDKVATPYYYIPIKVGREHYGFILKSKDKMTVHYSSYYNVFNLEAVEDKKDYLFLVEGIKDAYLLLRDGYSVVSMLTASVSAGFLEYVNNKYKKIIVVLDNDETGHRSAVKFREKAKKLRLNLIIDIPRDFKDMGDWFDIEKREAVELFYKRLVRRI
jgi:5S rRNA maturation endonuclease (ribonuclease M5)